MNVHKKPPSSWILCASKSFPGKSYYFNVQTGEAVWTLNDHEKNILKKENNIQKINNKLHNNYPEPTTHPDHTTDAPAPNPWPNASTSNQWQDYQQFAQYPPMLNQYMPMANTVMMPIQWPAPIWPYLTKKPTTDKVTQTSQIERNLIVQSCAVPLCQRFVNYEKPSLTFNKENKIINRRLISNNSNCKMERPGKSIPETVLDLGVRPVQNPKSMDSFQKMANPTFDNLDLNHKAQGNPNEIEESRQKFKANLDSFDLRFLLEAKKRKLIEKFPGSEIKKTKVLRQVAPPRKTVTFDLETDSVANSCNKNDSEVNVPKYNSNTDSLHIPSTPPQTDRNFNNTLATDTASDIIATASMDTDNTPTDNQPISQINIENNTNYNTERNPTIDEADVENYVATSNDPTERDGNNCSNISSNSFLSEDIHRILSRNKIMEIEKEPVLREFSSSYTVKNIWYIVADMDVLLEEHDVIEKILNTYQACRLLIPQCLHVEIESLCIGDCRGQKRVLIARQISRKISATNTQYTVEPPPYVENVNKNTMERILNCCIRAIRNNYYLVLITNDSCLLSRARSYNIRSYTPKEIKNGVIINPKSFSELKRLVVTLDNVDVDDYTFIKNKLSDLFSKRETYFNTVKRSPINNDKNCEILINITKPKSRIINDNNEKYDNNINTAEINNGMQILNIKCQNEDQNETQQNVKTLKIYSQNHNSNIFLFRDTLSESSPNITNIKNPVTISKYFQNNSKVITKREPKEIIRNHSQNEILKEPTNIKQNDSQNETLKLPSQNKFTNRFLFDNILSKINSDASNSQNLNTEISTYIQNNISKAMKNIESITNEIKQNYSSIIEDTHAENNKNNESQENNINSITTTAKRRIEKIIRDINTAKTEFHNQIENNEATNEKLLNTPKILSLKKEIYTSTPKQELNATDQIRSNFKKPNVSVEDSLENFCIKNKILMDNFKIRMDEWICSYTQIMEDLLRDILQLNFKQTNKMILSPINLHESLTCVKMLYNNARLRDIVENLVNLLMKHSCGKGKLKLDIKPQEFLKIIGCGVLLVETLKTILPSSPILLDYENYLNSLLNNMANQRMDLDPELLRPTNICRSEMNDANVNMRFNYRKEPGYVINYLRRHYKEWMEYDENVNNSKNVTESNTNQENCKIVRMFGKNASMLKIDNNKSISYINTSIENNPKQKAETKIIRLVQKQPENVKIIENSETCSKSRKCLFKSIFEDENKVEIVESNNIIDNKTTQEDNFKTMHNSKDQQHFENTQSNCDKVPSFVETKEMAGPKMISNDKPIETYKEPLDLDVLDYSETRSISYDDYSDNSKNDYNENVFEDQDKFNQNKTQSYLKDSDQNPKYFDPKTKIQKNNDDYAAENNIYASRNDDQTEKNRVLSYIDTNYAPNDKFDASLKEDQLKTMHEDILSESNYEESLNIQEIFGSRGNKNINFKTEDHHNENYATTDGNYAKIDEDYATANIDYAIDSNIYAADENGDVIDTNYACTDINYALNDENYALNQLTPRNDSTIDSGFESTSTQAYTVVKIFLSELGITFKVVYEFISNVIDEITVGAMCEERKNTVYTNANRCLQEMDAIIEELKCIIIRESHDNTPLKSLLKKAGVEAMADTRATKYRQMVSKSLEQAEILENALRTVMSITIGDNFSNNADSICVNMSCINLYE